MALPGVLLLTGETAQGELVPLVPIAFAEFLEEQLLENVEVEAKLQKRTAQVAIIKARSEYIASQGFGRTVRPSTPDPTTVRQTSKRTWENSLKTWRTQLKALESSVVSPPPMVLDDGEISGSNMADVKALFECGDASTDGHGNCRYSPTVFVRSHMRALVTNEREATPMGADVEALGSFQE